MNETWDQKVERQTQELQRIVWPPSRQSLRNLCSRIIVEVRWHDLRVAPARGTSVGFRESAICTGYRFS
jgi:hypothetical protein